MAWALTKKVPIFVKTDKKKVVFKKNSPVIFPLTLIFVIHLSKLKSSLFKWKGQCVAHFGISFKLPGFFCKGH